MFTSRKFIKMCAKARELQEQWKPKGYDWIACIKKWENGPRWFKSMNIYETALLSPYETDSCFYGPSVDCIKGRMEEFKKHFVWLPTLEQLFSMAGSDLYIDILPDKVHIDIRHFSTEQETLAQTLLSVVMWRKYGKIWDDEKGEWIKI